MKYIYVHVHKLDKYIDRTILRAIYTKCRQIGLVHNANLVCMDKVGELTYFCAT